MLPHATTNQGKVLVFFRHGKNIIDRKLRCMADVKNREHSGTVPCMHKTFCGGMAPCHLYSWDIGS